MKINKLKKLIREEIQKLQEQSRGIPCYVCVTDQSTLMDNFINFPNGQVAQGIDENGVFEGTFTSNMSIMGLEPGVPGPQGQCGIFLNDMEYSGMYISVTGAYNYTNINYDIAAAGCRPPVIQDDSVPISVNCGLCGDADGDGVVTYQDAMSVLNYTLTNASTNIPCLEYVDVSGDGSVNEVDAALIYDYVLGNITEFPGCSDSPDEIDLPTFCCDFDAFNFQPEVEGYNVNQIIMTNDPNNQCDNTLCTGCNDIDFESEVSSAGAVDRDWETKCR